MRAAFDSARPLWQGARHPGWSIETGRVLTLFSKGSPAMVKAEWGTKRSCPKCGTRFYDLGKEDPVVCVACGVAWDPEPVLKSKQPLPFDVPKKEVEEPEEVDDADLAAEDLGIEDIDESAEENPDDEVDIGGDDDIVVAAPGDEDEEI
jgi:uncharacterized protein (TIGR02300 family)